MKPAEKPQVVFALYRPHKGNAERMITNRPAALVRKRPRSAFPISSPSSCDDSRAALKEIARCAS